MSSRILLPPSGRGPSAPVPSSVYENWAGVDIMSYLDGGWRRQSLVYFGKRYLRRRRAVDQWSFSTGILSRTIVPAINATPCNPGFTTSRLRCRFFHSATLPSTLDTISAYSARRVNRLRRSLTAPPRPRHKRPASARTHAPIASPRQFSLLAWRGGARPQG